MQARRDDRQVILALKVMRDFKGGSADIEGNAIAILDQGGGGFADALLLIMMAGAAHQEGRFVAAAFVEAPMLEAALNHEVALMSRRVKVEHQDPADRFLAATAAVYELVLCTADERLLEGKGYKALSAR